jgi:hypothetical protein
MLSEKATRDEPRLDMDVEASSFLSPTFEQYQ